MRQLTPKQRAFCKHYLATLGNAPKAALRAYNCSSRNSARVMACKALKLPQVRELLKLELLKVGLPEKALLTMKESMKATKRVRVGGRTVEVPDHLIRIRAATFLLKLLTEGESRLTHG